MDDKTGAIILTRARRGVPGRHLARQLGLPEKQVYSLLRAHGLCFRDEHGRITEHWRLLCRLRQKKLSERGYLSVGEIKAKNEMTEAAKRWPGTWKLIEADVMEILAQGQRTRRELATMLKRNYGRMFSILRSLRLRGMVKQHYEGRTSYWSIGRCSKKLDQ